MRSLFHNPVNAHKLQNAEVRKKWDTKKSICRFTFATTATILILIGLEFASPNYSISTTIVEHAISKSDTLKAIIDNNWLQKLFVRGFDQTRSIPIYSGSSLKFAGFFLIFFVIAIHFLSNDPLSNSELLKNLAKRSNERPPGLMFRWMREIAFYAKHLPSNRLPERCASCRTTGCGNRLGFTEDRKTYHWNSIFAQISPTAANSLLHATHKCRFILFVRYSAFLAAAVLVPA
ncbi:MAG: hypothetical protein KDA57_20810, partial [Planctomycetales bacterium]|nr:hypothetical protein [Planctomycetales bacterium]